MDNPYIRLTREFNEGRLRAILASGQEHPRIVADASGDRPLLSRIGEGREVIERLLDEERRALMRKNEDRLDLYAAAARRWGAEWPGLSKELVGRPLAEALDRASYSHGVFDRDPGVSE